jgi:histidinol-phosphate phosphatase family protein
MTAPVADLVIPTLGRPSLAHLLEALAAGPAAFPGRILLVDDRRDASSPLLDDEVPAELAGRVEVLRGGGRGPAAARNRGWRAGAAAWTAFLDDDVLPHPGWSAALLEDLEAAAPGVGAVQGNLHVPLPRHRRPTDWERNVAGLETARWITADMAVRRAALVEVGGFDERFPRAFREDSDLALRLRAAGWEIARGRRRVDHPVRPAGRWVSVHLQAGNADDALMRILHGPGWQRAAGASTGRRPLHLCTTACAGLALAGLAAGRRRPAALAALAWAAATAEFAWRRIAPGPRTPDEVLTMAVTSAAIPPVATWHWLRGLARARRLAARRRPRPELVLLDRDGTLVVDHPYCGDPAAVTPMPGARQALDRLRRAGVALAVITNQSGIARGLLSRDAVDRVNRRVEDLLGPLGPWLVCPHGPEDGCGCRKPAPGLVRRAAELMGVDPSRCAVVGDIGADVEAARAAGARGVLVPTPATLTEEVLAAPEVAPTLGAAVDLLLSGRR